MKTILSLAVIAALFPQLVCADTATEEQKPGFIKQEVAKGKKKVEKEFETVEEHSAKNTPGIFIAGDFLYWQTHEDGLEYAVSGIGSSANINAVKGKTHEPDFEWDPGFRIGAGFTLEDALWDIGVYWTRLTSHASDSVTAAIPGSDDPSTRLFPILDHPGLGLGLSDVNSAGAKWELHYNVLDFLIARELKINRFLYLRPLGGLRFSWINQNYDVSYDYRAGPETTSVHLENDFWGIGVRGGLDAYWQLHKMFSVFAKAGFTIFHGSFDIEQKNRLASTGATYVNISDDFTRIVSELDIALGIRAEIDFQPKQKEGGPQKHEKTYRFEVLAGWEYVLYPKQNQTFLFTDAATDGKGMRERGDLSFQGFTLGALLHF